MMANALVMIMQELKSLYFAHLLEMLMPIPERNELDYNQLPRRKRTGYGSCITPKPTAWIVS